MSELVADAIFSRTEAADRRAGGDKLCYLGTPYRKYRHGLGGAYVHAAELAGRLLKTGAYKIYCPIVHSHPIALHAGLDFTDMSIWGPLNRLMMSRCDRLLVAHMDGWEESDGLAQEIAYFMEAGAPIFDLDPLTLTMARRK
jgi:hypothetical protein